LRVRSHTIAFVSPSIPLFFFFFLSSSDSLLLFQGFAPMPTHHRARSHASRDASSRASTTKRRHDFFPITPGASHRPRPPPSAPHRHHPPPPIARARPPRRVASIRRAAFARAASTDADPDAHRIASHRIASRTFKHRPLIAAEADIANMANGGSRVTSSDDARATRGEGRRGVDR